MRHSCGFPHVFEWLFIESLLCRHCRFLSYYSNHQDKQTLPLEAEIPIEKLGHQQMIMHTKLRLINAIKKQHMKRAG